LESIPEFFRMTPATKKDATWQLESARQEELRKPVRTRLGAIEDPSATFIPSQPSENGHTASMQHSGEPLVAAPITTRGKADQSTVGNGASRDDQIEPWAETSRFHPKPIRAGQTEEAIDSFESPLVFLCHSSGDKEQVRRLYQRLKSDGARCWFDEEDLLPGQKWEYEIRRAIRRSKFVLACLTGASVSRAGFVQKELKLALDIANEQPEGGVYIVPVRLEECAVPERLEDLQWVDLFEDGGYERLLRGLVSCARSSLDNL
jgi:hypothetical protein